MESTPQLAEKIYAPFELFLNQKDLKTRTLFLGNRLVFPLAHSMLFSLSYRGQKILVIDCAIRFRLHLLVEHADRHFVAPDDILKNIYIQRAFTPQQTLEAARNLNKRDFPFIFFLAPAKQILDPEVSFAESIFLLEKLYRQLSFYSKGKLFLIEKADYSNPVFRSTRNALFRCVEERWHLHNTHNQKAHLSVHRNPPPKEVPHGKNSGPVLPTT